MPKNARGKGKGKETDELLTAGDDEQRDGLWFSQSINGDSPHSFLSSTNIAYDRPTPPTIPPPIPHPNDSTLNPPISPNPEPIPRVLDVVRIPSSQLRFFPAPDLLNLHPALQPNKTVLHPQARTRTRMIVMIMAMISQTLYVEHPSRSTPIDPTGTDRPSYLTCLPSPNHFGPHLPTSPYRLLNHHVLAVVNLPLSYACDPLNLLQSKLGITTVSQTDFHHSSPSLRRLLTCPLSQARQVLVLALALVLDVYHKVNQGGHWNRLDHIGQRLRKARRQLREEVRVSTRARPRARAVANRGKRWSLSRG